MPNAVNINVIEAFKKIWYEQFTLDEDLNLRITINDGEVIAGIEVAPLWHRVEVTTVGSKHSGTVTNRRNAMELFETLLKTTMVNRKVYTYSIERVRFEPIAIYHGTEE